MKKYQEIINELLDKKLINRKDYFDYSDSPNCSEFEAAFTFYEETLLHNNSYGIEPAYLFFRNARDVNARAAFYNGVYMIAINAGTIIFLLDAFKSRSLFDESALNEWNNFQRTLDSSIEKLMYENTLHFTFYHEMAHLIQNSSLLEIGLYEQPVNIEYSARRHILEIDADEYSAISIGAHGLQYARSIFGDNVSTDNIEKVFIIMCCSVLMYLLSFPTNKREIYYNEMSHPHPIIRISYIIFVIIDYVNQAIEQIGLDKKINSKNVMIQVIELSSSLSEKIFGENLVDRYKEYLQSEAKNITNYLRDIQHLYKDDESLAVQKWNALARRLHKD